MHDQTLEFFSGFPMILAPNAPAKLKKAKLDGRVKDVYTDRRGNTVQVSGLNRDYHLYVLASRTSAFFGRDAEWDYQTLIASTSLVFCTYPMLAEIYVAIVLDGTSPYTLPDRLRPRDVRYVSVFPPEIGGLPLAMTFTHSDGTSVSCLLSPDLLHFARFPQGHEEITDFKVEYVGIACGPNGNRTVFERARAHETVVEIQGDLQQRFGNRSLFIFAYDPGYLIRSDWPGMILETGSNLINRLVVGGMNSLYEAMEASLISYFQPIYNTEFKKFPLNKPNWLDGGYRSLNGYVLNVNSVRVTLVSDNSLNPNGRWSFGRFRSPVRSPETVHCTEITNLKHKQISAKYSKS